jgi:hypothetical protein
LYQLGNGNFLEKITMAYSKVSIQVDVVCDAGSVFDTASLRDAIEAALPGNVPVEAMTHVGEPTHKSLSEQGMKVWRSRVKHVSAEQAGDAAGAKPVEAKAAEVFGAA